jgi:membrane protease YdiL (CAAX protease family)
LNESILSKEDIMSTIKTFIKTHPVLTYFALVFIISWGGLVIVVGGPGGITAENTTTPFVFGYLATAAGPILASVLLTGLFYGRTGYRELLSRLFKWRVGARWYLIALLVAPLSVLPTVFALSLTSPAFLPGFFATSDTESTLLFGFSTGEKASFLLFVLMLGLVNGFLEELGWTGFAIPKLTARYGVLTTGLSVGLLWGAWHFLSNYLGSASAATELSLFLFLPALLFTFLPPFRVLMVWVYDRTESLLLAILMHASLNIFWLISMPLAITAVQRATWYLAWAVVLWVLVAAAWATWSYTRPVGSRSRSALPVGRV